MDPTLSDIRILKLAEMYERAYEAFVLEMAQKYVTDMDIRQKLRKLVDPNDGHGERIAAAIERLNQRVRDIDRASVERAALRDVLHVERSARAFYMKFVEEIHDPGVAVLFRTLAREESEHIRAAEDALAISDRKSGRPHHSEDTDRMLRVMEYSSPRSPTKDPHEAAAGDQTR